MEGDEGQILTGKAHQARDARVLVADDGEDRRLQGWHLGSDSRIMQQEAAVELWRHAGSQDGRGAAVASRLKCTALVIGGLWPPTRTFCLSPPSSLSRASAALVTCFLGPILKPQ